MNIRRLAHGPGSGQYPHLAFRQVALECEGHCWASPNDQIVTWQGVDFFYGFAHDENGSGVLGHPLAPVELRLVRNHVIHNGLTVVRTGVRVRELTQRV